MLDATSISKQPKKLRFSNESVFLATLVLVADTWRFLASLMLSLQSITAPDRKLISTWAQVDPNELI
jgi:hypothetical protein